MLTTGLMDRAHAPTGLMDSSHAPTITLIALVPDADDWSNG